MIRSTSKSWMLNYIASNMSNTSTCSSVKMSADEYAKPTGEDKVKSYINTFTRPKRIKKHSHVRRTAYMKREFKIINWVNL